MSFYASRDERFYVQVTNPYAATIPNAAGTATLANGDACRHINVALNRRGDVIRSAAKTGAPGLLAGIQGLRGGDWSLEIPWQMSGAAGTAPDMGPLLDAMFGTAGAVSAGVSVTYALAATQMGLTLWAFHTPAGAQSQQRVGWGALVQEFEIATNQGELVARMSGPLGYIIDSVNFATYDTAAKAGLTTFPTEPASPTYTGTIIPGFIGSATINGVSTFNIADFSIRSRFNRELRHPFSSYYPNVPVAGVREITLTLGIYEEDVAALNALRFLQHSKTSFDATVVFGTVAGSIATFALNNLVIPGEVVDGSGPEFIIRFADAPASMTNTTSQDELTLTLT
jgi:hypothetical protein